MKKYFIGIASIALLFILVLGYWGYNQIFRINTLHEQPEYIFIPTDSDFNQLVQNLVQSGILLNEKSFRRVSKWMKFENVKPGRYEINTAQNNRLLVGLLRSGNQTPVNVTISTARTIEEAAGIISAQIEPDSTAILEFILNATWLESHSFKKYNILGLIIPNTYQFYWNTSADQFAKRMLREYQAFWSVDHRNDNLKNLMMTAKEVTSLASIVEKESIQISERPIIAGVYLNRLRRGIYLQADPTVVFATGDFSIRRVLNKHLAIDSPYNTYKYKGLPPGPICMPSISSIEAVLNAEEHEYLFFCAKPGYNGAHSFAKTNAEHERNARIYRRWLNQEGIRG